MYELKVYIEGKSIKSDLDAFDAILEFENTLIPEKFKNVKKMNFFVLLNSSDATSTFAFSFLDFLADCKISLVIVNTIDLLTCSPPRVILWSDQFDHKTLCKSRSLFNIGLGMPVSPII
ncbi:hypothetical protein BpHYR1_050309 [Brachionus plicatilis]|uniref:Uncharacterized protein n=1 Tax=Brachionus plicatilis TaxID=10195 RepID=A0A3M7P4T6_BRAPC|nr:hypothetical protein BpHYR1_050309 [Brachionus plicatilis]